MSALAETIVFFSVVGFPHILVFTIHQREILSTYCKRFKRVLVASTGEVLGWHFSQDFPHQAAAGPIDIFVANAGIPCNGGYEVPNDEWDRIFKVHVRETQLGYG